jgi:GAF domain-containing protein
MLSEGHKLAVGGNSMIGWATANRQPRIALNVGQDDGINVITRFNNPHLPLTRSELALPIQVSEVSVEEENTNDINSLQAGQDIRVLGAMTIQSTQERAFDQDDIVILQGIADALASAIENARLFAATEASLEEIRVLHRQYLEQAWRAETARRGEIGYSYENEERSPVIQSNRSTAETEAETTGAEKLNARPTESLEIEYLEIPIRLRDQVIGSLTLEPGVQGAMSEDGSHTWSQDEMSLVEAVTNQAALALENARLLEETRRKVNLEHTTSTITSKLWASVDVETILRTALQELGATLGAHEGLIELLPLESIPGDGQQSPGEKPDASD